MMQSLNMMQSLDIISVNFWQIVISLCNLLILFLIVKKFLFQPVKKMLAKREADLKSQYDNAEQAEQSALENKKAWEEKMTAAKQSAEEIEKDAMKRAERQSDKILLDAKEKAEGILKRAEADAALEKKKAEKDIQYQIVDVSALLTEKMLQKKLSDQDHHELISSFMQEIGETNDADK